MSGRYSEKGDKVPNENLEQKVANQDQNAQKENIEKDRKINHRKRNHKQQIKNNLSQEKIFWGHKAR